MGAISNSEVAAVRREAIGPTACCGARAVLLRRAAGAGGMQLRAYCTECWGCSRALPHSLVQEFVAIDDLPVADVDLLERAARDAWRRASWKRQ